MLLDWRNDPPPYGGYFTDGYGTRISEGACIFRCDTETGEAWRYLKDVKDNFIVDADGELIVATLKVHPPLTYHHPDMESWLSFRQLPDTPIVVESKSVNLYDREAVASRTVRIEVGTEGNRCPLIYLD